MQIEKLERIRCDELQDDTLRVIADEADASCYRLKVSGYDMAWEAIFLPAIGRAGLAYKGTQRWTSGANSVRHGVGMIFAAMEPSPGYGLGDGPTFFVDPS